MSGINYTVFVNPSGEARIIYSYFRQQRPAELGGKKWARRQRASGPFELLARRVARENSSTNFYRVPTCSKRTRPRLGEKVLPDYLPEEQAIQLPRVPYYVVSTWERKRERETYFCPVTRHFPRHLVPRIISQWNGKKHFELLLHYWIIIIAILLRVQLFNVQ